MRTSIGIDSLPPTPLDAALLQDAQELHLHRQRHVADFVEKERALVGLLEAALALADGAR